MLDTELDLVVLFGALVVAQAKKELLDLIHYIQEYKHEELRELWVVVKRSLSDKEQRWLTSVLKEATNAEA